MSALNGQVHQRCEATTSPVARTLAGDVTARGPPEPVQQRRRPGLGGEHLLGRQGLRVARPPARDVVHVHHVTTGRGGVQAGDDAVGEPLPVQPQRMRAPCRVDVGVEQGGEQQLGVEQVTDDDVVPAGPDRLPRDAPVAHDDVRDDGRGDALRRARGDVLLDRGDPAAQAAALPRDGAAGRRDVEVDQVHLGCTRGEPRERHVVRVAGPRDGDPRAVGDDRVQHRPELGPRPAPARRAVGRRASVAARVGDTDEIGRLGAHRVPA